MTGELRACAALGGAFKVDVEMNGCNYLFKVSTRLSEDKYEGSQSVVCPEGKK